MRKTSRTQAQASFAVLRVSAMLSCLVTLIVPKSAFCADNCTIIDTSSSSDDVYCYFQLQLKANFVDPEWGDDPVYIQYVCGTATAQMDMVKIDDGSTTGSVRCCEAHVSTNCTNFQKTFYERQSLVEAQGGQQNYSLGCPILTMDACDAFAGQQGEPRLAPFVTSLVSPPTSDPIIDDVRQPTPTSISSSSRNVHAALWLSLGAIILHVVISTYVA